MFLAPDEPVDPVGSDKELLVEVDLKMLSVVKCILNTQSYQNNSFTNFKIKSISFPRSTILLLPTISETCDVTSLC